MKRTLCALLCFLLLTGVLTGCTEPEGPETSSTPVNPLTGMAIAEEEVGKRLVAVDVNNVVQSWPQYGVAQADIVYEMETEYGITRFICVYYDIAAVGQIGSIRSTRENQLALAYPLGPVFVHIGYSIDAGAAIQSYNIEVLDGDYIPELVYIDADRIGAGYAVEQTKMTTGGHIAAACAQKGVALTTDDPVVAFPFIDPEAEKIIPGSGVANVVTFHFSTGQDGSPNYDGDFRYNAATGQYEKHQCGEAQMDVGNGQQMTFDNVFVLFGDIAGRAPGANVLIRFEYEAGGSGYYFSQGHYVEITWTKDTFGDNFTFYDADTGETLAVNCGKSYVAVVNKHKKDLLEIR